MKIAGGLLQALARDPIGGGLLGGEVRVCSESGAGILPYVFLVSGGIRIHASEFGRPVRLRMIAAAFTAAGRHGALPVSMAAALAVLSGIGFISILLVLFGAIRTGGMDFEAIVSGLIGAVGFGRLSLLLLKVGLGARMSTMVLDGGLSAHERLDLLAGRRR